MTNIISIANFQDCQTTKVRLDNTESSDETLEEAATNGNLAQVEKLINQSMRMRAYKQALANASSKGQIHILQTLMEGKVGRRKFKTLLKRAGCRCCECTHKGVIEDSIYHDLIERAAINGHLHVLMYLVKQRADVEFIHDHAFRSTYKDDDILEKAAAYGHLETVKYLTADEDVWLYLGANNWDALTNAVSHGHLEVVQHLVDYMSENHSNASTCALMRAATCGHLEIVRALAKSGAVADADGGKALVFAAKCGHLRVVEYLLEWGINPDCRNGNALIAAIYKRSLPMVKCLVSHGGNVAIQDGAPLKAALEIGDLEMLKYLIEHGADAYIDDIQLERCKDKLRSYCGEKWLTIIQKPALSKPEHSQNLPERCEIVKSSWWQNALNYVHGLLA